MAPGASVPPSFLIWVLPLHQGSLVFFNQATMYQSSEMDCSTVQEAIKAGGSGLADYGRSAQEAFTKYAKYISVQRAEQA